MHRCFKGKYTQFEYYNRQGLVNHFKKQKQGLVNHFNKQKEKACVLHNFR